jgi:hypothetical protein
MTFYYGELICSKDVMFFVREKKSTISLMKRLQREIKNMKNLFTVRQFERLEKNEGFLDVIVDEDFHLFTFQRVGILVKLLWNPDD